MSNDLSLDNNNLCPVLSPWSHVCSLSCFLLCHSVFSCTSVLSTRPWWTLLTTCLLCVQDVVDCLVESRDFLSQCTVRSIGIYSFFPETDGKVLGKELLHFNIWRILEPEHADIFTVDLSSRQTIHALDDVLLEILAPNDVSTVTCKVQVGENFEWRVVKVLDTLSFTARHHPIKDVLVNHLVSPNNRDLFFRSRLLEISHLELVDRQELILPLGGEGSCYLLGQTFAQDMGFCILMSFVQDRYCLARLEPAQTLS